MFRKMRINQRDTMVPGEGLEPPTFGLQNRCTATVLTRQVDYAATVVEFDSVGYTTPESTSIPTPEPAESGPG